MKIEVLYEDNDILVAVKPYGLPSQPDKKNSENMVSMLKLRIFEKERPGVPMRVDHGRMMLGDTDKGYNPQKLV